MDLSSGLFQPSQWTLLLFPGAACLLGLYLCVFKAPCHPQQIPSVPFWVTLLPIFFEVDQQDIFCQYISQPLQAHGVIKLFFAGQWNVLVQRPAMVAEVFRHEHIYHKSGNHKKIPHSVLAEYLGSNIISAREDEWRRYRVVIQPGLQTPLDSSIIFRHVEQLSAVFLQLQERDRSQGVSVQSLLQRYSSANLLHCVLGQADLSSQMMEIDQDVPLHTIQLLLKQHLFQPIFMNFPVLDWLGWAVPSRRRARQLIQDFSTELQIQILQAHPLGSSTSVGGRLVAAWRNGTLTTQEFRDNLNVIYVAGQENPQLLLTSTLYLLAKYPNVQQRLREEIQQNGTIDDDASPVVWKRLPYLSATILECARLFPPISQLINRRVSAPTWLAGSIYLPAGTYVGYHSYATNRDPTAWGSDANDFRPERWGHTHEQIFATYRRAKARAEFISFHGGPRACLGEKFALLQMRITLLVLVRSLCWTLDPTWKDKMVPAGPLHPRQLRLMFTKHNQDAAT